MTDTPVRGSPNIYYGVRCRIFALLQTDGSEPRIDPVIRINYFRSRQPRNIASEIQDINKNNNKLSDELSDTEDRNSELEKQVVEKTKKLTELKEVLNSKNGILEEVNIEIANLKQKHEFIVERINKSTEIIESLNRELQQIKVNSNENNEEISARVDAIDRFVKEVEKSRQDIERLNKEIGEEKEKKKKTFFAQTYFYETVDCLFYPFLSGVDLLFMPLQGYSLPVIAARVRSACVYVAREDGRRR